MATFSTAVTRSDDTTIVHLSGELDIATVTAAAPRSRPTNSTGTGARALVLDLTELHLPRLDRDRLLGRDPRPTRPQLGKRVTIRNVPPAVRRVLEIGGLLALFEPSADRRFD